MAKQRVMGAVHAAIIRRVLDQPPAQPYRDRCKYDAPDRLPDQDPLRAKQHTAHDDERPGAQCVLPPIQPCRIIPSRVKADSRGIPKALQI